MTAWKIGHCLRMKLRLKYHVVPDGIPIKLYAASLSTRHGERITLADRKALAREVFEENPNFNLEILIKFIDVSKSTAANYVADIRARRKEAQKMVAYRLHRLGWISEETGNVVGLTASRVRDFVSEFPSLEKQTKSLIDSGIPHLDLAERFNMPLISERVKDSVQQQLLDERYLMETTLIFIVEQSSQWLTGHQKDFLSQFPASKKEIKKVLDSGSRNLLYDGRNKEYLSKILAVLMRTMKRWLERKDSTFRQERERKIYEMWLACCTQEEIAKAVGLDPEDKSLRLSGKNARWPNYQIFPESQKENQTQNQTACPFGKPA